MIISLAHAGSMVSLIASGHTISQVICEPIERTCRKGLGRGGVLQVSANGLYHNILACRAPRHLDAIRRTSSGCPYKAEIWLSRDALFLRGCTGSRESDTGHEYTHS
jgi:hypothetical protein